MANKYGLPEKEMKKIRIRDADCVYCHKKMYDYPHSKGTPSDKATIEHFFPPLNDAQTVAYCCGSCNSSRGPKELLDWFKTKYCIDKNINEKTISEPVKKYYPCAYLEWFVNQRKWVFAKTMPDIPHYYIVRDNLEDKDKKIFDEFNKFIKNNGYVNDFYSKQYSYFNIGKYKYWVIENILNRATL